MDADPLRDGIHSARRSWFRPWIAAAVLAGAVIAAYGASLSAPFIFDDEGAVVNNPTIRQLWSWRVFNPPADGSTTTGRPLVNLSYALNYAIGGEDVWSYHALNLAIHGLAALALMGLVRRTVERWPAWRVAPGARAGVRPPSALAAGFSVALLWALHPLQTESVICIAQRTELLCGLFYLLTLYGFARGVEATGAPVGRGDATTAPPAPGRWWLAGSILAGFAGVASKEVMVTAPLVVLLYDRTFVAGSFAAAWRQRRAYYLALASTWLLLAWLVLRGGGGRGVAAGFGLGVSPWDYLLTQCRALVLYLKLSVWPHPLVLDYGTAVVRSLDEVWGRGVGVLALLAAGGWALGRRPVVGFAAAWFFVILAPSSSVVPLVTQTIAEHRMYLPLAAVVGLAVLGGSVRFGRRAGWVVAVVAVMFGALTFARTRDYRDGVTIWSDTVAKLPLNARAHNNFALALHRAGRDAAADAQFARAIALQPAYFSAHYNWGTALLDRGRVAEAVVQFEAALRSAPNQADAQLNLGNALVRERRAAEAIPHYEAALHLAPALDAHYDLGVALIDAGRYDEAAAQLRAARALNPARPDTPYQLGRAAELAGRRAEAEQDYEETLRLAPDHVGAHRQLGLLLARREQLEPAAGQFRAVIRLRPDDADARANLGNVLLLQGRTREAIASYEEALRLRPGDARTEENLRTAREALP